MTYFNASDAPEVFAPAMEYVAHELLGEPNRSLSSQYELRFGTNGSLSVDLHHGVWHDHEGGAGGGVLDLIVRERGGVKEDAAHWLKSQGHMPDNPPEKIRLVASYEYTDEDGVILYQACRMEPKSFRQRRPDGQGGWIWNVKGVRQVPYRLTDLVSAKEGSIIYVVEGEKDADRLAGLGLVATTNAGGAGKWRAEFADYLAGKRVAVLPDNDDSGRDHARKVLASLHTKGIEAKVVTLPELPDKGDVSDWMDMGGNIEALQRLYDHATDELTDKGQVQAKAEFSLIRADALEFVEPEFVIAGLVESETLSLLFADPGSGKSFVALDMAASIATGHTFHGRDVKPGAVIYICGEGKNGIRRRLTAWERHHGVSLQGAPLFVSSTAAQLLSPDHVRAIVAAITAAAQ